MNTPGFAALLLDGFDSAEFNLRLTANLAGRFTGGNAFGDALVQMKAQFGVKLVFGLLLAKDSSDISRRQSGDEKVSRRKSHQRSAFSNQSRMGYC
jgi:hypothetical protein